MTTRIQDVNIRLVLSRLRPGAAFGWQGDGDYGNTLADVIWQDPNSTKPDEATVLAEWADCEAEEAEADTLYLTLLANAGAAVGKTLDELTVADRDALVDWMAYNAGGIEPRTGTVKPLADWYG